MAIQYTLSKILLRHLTLYEIEVALNSLIINQNVCVKWRGVPKRIIKIYRLEYRYSRWNKVELSSDDECWTRCLSYLPVFKLKYINLHRLSSVKDKSTVNLKQLKEKEDLRRNIVRAYSRPILHSTIERCSHLCKLYEALFW